MWEKNVEKKCGKKMWEKNVGKKCDGKKFNRYYYYYFRYGNIIV